MKQTWFCIGRGNTSNYCVVIENATHEEAEKIVKRLWHFPVDIISMTNIWRIDANKSRSL